ncbi:hypothetical protein [Lysinibacillus xylanilyticus]|uniref:Uncharacterized protein n=1 Tax=Lysinibacillus xylanilyticus TaxID=582475 RepID=A0A2M9Q667_9BACI|nr:hypothetical protein [Lysinibacillus xylanilyticus]PJO43548.1 hypothetical protein CWD94_11815 [Lysinibacillus xylanilyticus]
MDNRTPTEIEELSLRTPRPVVIFLRESEAAAANVFCAKAKRQRQMCFLRESEATAAITPRRNLIGGSLAWKKQLYGTR